MVTDRTSETFSDARAFGRRTVGHMSPRCREAEHQSRILEHRARQGGTSRNRMDREGYVNAPKRGDHPSAEPRRSESGKYGTTIRSRENSMERYEVVDVASRQFRMRRRDLRPDPSRVRATQDGILDAKVEMELGRLGSLDVGRAFEPRDYAHQRAPFSRDHRDKRTREPTRVGERSSRPSRDLVRNPMFESADECVDVARRRHRLTRRT